ncbi:BAG family molecular chaperone regulator 5, mitochondrial [Cucurbita maxima]|uniref:BAG family molecular chaperone regulator 5, mitochondrial n=1 Tax=Cucurbita maxima TaxID=3661 RepID=A0A6J1KJ48_CUCMA|nr:BAG family molecular chaperone regulator 5, mitochondrial [Cucurbita maxima]
MNSTSFYYATATATSFSYSSNNHHSTPPNSTPVLLQPSPPPSLQSSAAAKIQAAYRSHRIRSLYKTIAAIDREADQIQALIQRQETVDAVRSNDHEKLRMNEALMSILLRLDSVPGIDPAVREARRKVSRRIVGLQEILDAVSEAKVDFNGWDCDGFVRNWDETLAEMEAEVCRERGGDEMERFCAQFLGFRCFQRFLSGS